MRRRWADRPLPELGEAVLFATGEREPGVSEQPGVRAIDAWVNVNMGSTERPAWLTRVAEDYFQRADAIFKDISVAEMLEIMDRSGVEKAILSIAAANPSEGVLRFAQDEPDRFVLSAYVDPRSGMAALRA